jgi:hypothetical protein
VQVIGKSVLLSDEPDWGSHPCVLATASDEMLEHLQHYPERTRFNVEYEVLPAPAFPPLVPDAISMDRRVNIRGQWVSPWCESEHVFWILNARPVPAN